MCVQFSKKSRSSGLKISTIDLDLSIILKKSDGQLVKYSVVAGMVFFLRPPSSQ